MLYIVATPIGNLSETSYRAVETLKSVSVIAAEDTRKSAVLLRHFSIDTPMVSYQKFNERESTVNLIKSLQNGEDVALISDAGMPLICDPGSILVEECIKAGIDFTVVSGACAAVNAFVLSGFKHPFTVIGFLPDKVSERDRLILDYALSPASLVFYSPPQSVAKDLEFLYKKLGERKIAIIRELTKKFESIYRGTLGNPPEFTKKGEFCLVIEGYKSDSGSLSATELAEEYMSLGLDKMDAVKRAARDKGISKSELYKALLKKEIKDE